VVIIIHPMILVSPQQAKTSINLDTTAKYVWRGDGELCHTATSTTLLLSNDVLDFRSDSSPTYKLPARRLSRWYVIMLFSCWLLAEAGNLLMNVSKFANMVARNMPLTGLFKSPIINTAHNWNDYPFLWANTCNCHLLSPSWKTRFGNPSWFPANFQKTGNFGKSWK